MRLNVIKHNSIKNIILPEEIKGSFWIDSIDVNGNSPSDASKKLQQMTKQPGVKQLLNTNTNVNAKVHLNKEHIERLRESSVSFSKQELNNLLMK